MIFQLNQLYAFLYFIGLFLHHLVHLGKFHHVQFSRCSLSMKKFKSGFLPSHADYNMSVWTLVDSDESKEAPECLVPAHCLFDQLENHTAVHDEVTEGLNMVGRTLAETNTIVGGRPSTRASEDT